MKMFPIIYFHHDNYHYQTMLFKNFQRDLFQQTFTFSLCILIVIIFCRYDDKWHALFLRAEEREKIGFKAS